AYSVTEGIYLFLSRKLPKIYSYTTAEGMKLMRDALQTDSMNGAM
ncbi:MAG: diaminopimelate decarboxylase, partial [Lachnospiraceae bacterium]